MKAISEDLTLGQAALKALEAGADLVEYRSFEACQEAYLYVKSKLEDGSLSNSLVNEKYDRIISLKKNYLASYAPKYIPDVCKSVGVDSHQEIVDQVVQA